VIDPVITTTRILMTEATHTSRVLRSVTYPATKDHVTRARVLTRQTIGDHPKCDDALLLVTELTTNAVRHSGARVFTVTISETTSGDLKITVIDDGRADTVPHLCVIQPADSIDGRGMRLVDELAKQWGITRERTAGLAVWFLLEGRPKPPAHPSEGAFEDRGPSPRLPRPTECEQA
jgi:anti-sigma regulatory factor (Ser/Thr protein kinase)